MKGILFKPQKIKAITDSSPDKEWQTRRVIKPQPERGVIAKCPGDDISFSNFEMYLDYRKTGWIPIGKTIKPRDHAGETVYIKEAIHRFNVEDASYDSDFTPVMFLQSANRFQVVYHFEMLERWILVIYNGSGLINFGDFCTTLIS